MAFKWGVTVTKYLLMGRSSKNPFNPNESDHEITDLKEKCFVRKVPLLNYLW